MDDDRANSSFFSETVEDWYRAACFEALDLVIDGIKDCFYKHVYAIYHNLVELLAKERLVKNTVIRKASL